MSNVYRFKELKEGIFIGTRSYMEYKHALNGQYEDFSSHKYWVQDNGKFHGVDSLDELDQHIWEKNQ